MRIISMQNGGDVKQVFSRLSLAVSSIEKLVHEFTQKGFQHNEHLGVITCCPTNLGTALRGSVLINIENLSNQLGESGLKEQAKKFKLDCRGL